MIPKIIHNIWLQGYENLPEKTKNTYNHIKKLNTGWDFIFWNETMILELLKKYPKVYHVYENIKHLSGNINSNAIKSDIARYIIMKEYGGLYFDIDFVCVSSFDSLFHENNTIYVASSKVDFLDYIYPFYKPMYCSCFMAFEKDHPIWEEVIQILINATTKYQVGRAIDVSLQTNQYNLIVLTDINGVYNCNEKNAICYTPIESSWNNFRPLLKIINCHRGLFICMILIIILIIILILIYIPRTEWKIRYSNRKYR